MQRFNFRNYQPMNLIVRTSEGNELWLGDYGAATDLKLLKQKKISNVLTAAAMLNIHYPKEAGINHKVINAYDIPSYKMTPHFQQVYQFISDALSSGNVLVHCAAGISRSTTCVIVYLMRTKGTSFKQSLEMCKSKRSIVNPNYGFQNQLIKYQLILKKGIGKQKEKKNPNIKLQNKSAIKFMGQPKSISRFNSTLKDQKLSDNKVSQLRSNNLGGNKTMIGIRGKSTNFHYRPENNRDGVKKITQQFINYKLLEPKIVTIKR